VSIGTKTQVRWSGLLFGIMMFLFVAMIHLPGASRAGSMLWTIVIGKCRSAAAAGFWRGLRWTVACAGQESLIHRGPRADRDPAASFSASSIFCIRWDFPEFRSETDATWIPAPP